MSQFLNDTSIDGNLTITNGGISTPTMTATQFGYLSGATSNIQQQITDLTSNTTGKILKTMTEVSANTNNTYIAGATAVKELAGRITSGTTDLTAGSSALTTGSIYLVYQ